MLEVRMLIAPYPKIEAELAELVALAEGGLEVVLTRGEAAVVRLIPVRPGEDVFPPEPDPDAEFCAGLTKREWDALDKEIEQMFEDSINRPIDEPYEV